MPGLRADNGERTVNGVCFSIYPADDLILQTSSLVKGCKGELLPARR